MSGSGNDGGADPGYAEYPLIAAPSLGYHHHILRLVPSSSTAQAEENLVADWARPLKLNRKDWWSIRKKADEERKAVKRQQQEQQKAEAEADDEDIKDVKMQDVESSDPLAAAAPPKAARDESLIAPGPTGTPSRAKPAGGGGGRFKKKTKQIHIAADQAARILRRQENRPWLLEDSGPPGHSQRWIGEFEAAHDAGGTSATASASAVKTDSPLGVGSGEYVVFRLAGPPAGGEDGRNAFEVVPIGRTYRFTPRPTYDTLTADEAAEAYEKMQKVGTRDDFGRWFMRRRNPGAANGAAGGMLKREGSAGRDQVSASVVNGRRFRAVDQSGIRERDDLFDDDDGGEEDVKPRIRRGRSAGAGGEGEFDEFDFDEEFADDEEGAGNLNDEAMEEDELREIEERLKREMRTAGRAGDDERMSEGRAPDEDDILPPGGNKTGAGGAEDLSREGRATRKLLKRKKEAVWESDDEERNPYASQDEDSDVEFSDSSPDGKSPSSRPGSVAGDTGSRSGTPAPGLAKSHSRPSHAHPHLRGSRSGRPSAPNSRNGSPAPRGTSPRPSLSQRATSRGGTPQPVATPTAGSNSRRESRGVSPAPSTGGRTPSSMKRKLDPSAPGSSRDPKRGPSSVGTGGSSNLPPPDQGTGLIQEAEIIAFLKDRIVTTKDLLAHFKLRLRDDRNKKLIQNIVKKVGQMMGGNVTLKEGIA